LAGAATVQFVLDFLLSHRNARRAAINDNTHSTTMRFTPGGNTKKLAPNAGHSATHTPQLPSGQLTRCTVALDLVILNSDVTRR